MVFLDPENRGYLKSMEGKLFQHETVGVICSNGPCVPAWPSSYCVLSIWIGVYQK